MSTDPISTAVAYYTAMSHKDVDGIARYLHPDVQLQSPAGKTEGKEAVVQAAKRHFMPLIDTLTIRATFGSPQQAILVYDVQAPAPVGKFSAAALMDIHDGLITRIELLFDPSPVMRALAAK